MRIRTLMPFSFLAVAILAAPPPTPAGASGPGGQDAGTRVGTIEIVTDAGTRVFHVEEGPPSEGFASGYNESPVGESMVFGVSLMGTEEGSEVRMLVQTGVYRSSMEQLCDPFSNNIEMHGSDRGGRLRPGGKNSTSCPDNQVDINVTEASFDEEAETLHVEGTFSGPLGRGDDAIQVREGAFQATLRSFQAF